MNDESSVPIEHALFDKPVKVRGRPDDVVEGAFKTADGRVWFMLHAGGSAWEDEVTVIDGDPSIAGLRAVADAISARAREIKPLDLVTLLSGGPTMVVEAIDDDSRAAVHLGVTEREARCWWTDHDGDLHVASIPLPLLRLDD